MTMMAEAGNESPNKSSEGKTSANRHNEGKKNNLISSTISLIQTQDSMLWLSDQIVAFIIEFFKCSFYMVY